MRTSGTVIRWVSITGSWTSPRTRISARAWRTSSPARSERWECPLAGSRAWPRGIVFLNSEGALHRLHPVAFDHIADPHILVILERHTAFLAGDHLLDIILKALELRQLALVNHHVVADEAHVGAPLDRSLGDSATGDLAHFGDIENLQDEGIAEHCFPQYRRQQAGHCFFHVIDEIVDDTVVTDFHAIALGHFARLLVGAHVEADDGRA